MTRLKLHNPGNYKVLGATVKIKGHTRTFAVIVCYLPPSLKAEESRECMQYISDLVHEAKRKSDSPHVIVSGDFNQFEVEKWLEEHSDLKECNVGPSRGNRSIDRTFTNFDACIDDSGTLPPLTPDNPDLGAPSDI